VATDHAPLAGREKRSSSSRPPSGMIGLGDRDPAHLRAGAGGDADPAASSPAWPRAGRCLQLPGAHSPRGPADVTDHRPRGGLDL
jgi:dihydroorotase-like cyclic amidohydrolase